MDGYADAVEAVNADRMVPESECAGDGRYSPHQCRALVRVYLGQRKPGGSWNQCGNRPRPGFKTCRVHASREGSTNAAAD